MPVQYHHAPWRPLVAADARGASRLAPRLRNRRHRSAGRAAVRGLLIAVVAGALLWGLAIWAALALGARVL